ncbi:MAG: hypothetical protein HY231_11270 [Acidobacteria bacterium]|nr:hypothetical protein [Acidobacteriota bacterium]
MIEQGNAPFVVTFDVTASLAPCGFIADKETLSKAARLHLQQRLSSTLYNFRLDNTNQALTLRLAPGIIEPQLLRGGSIILGVEKANEIRLLRR